MRRSMVIFHKKSRAALKILLENLILKLSKKERSDACELEKKLEKNKTCKTLFRKLANLSEANSL